ncbi:MULTISPECIES: type I restriction-modification system subunit M [Aerococcus]|uniref:type I restriction-modification system subunit M n=1 Tax=Aerococcus TaxID=1375 RepID=UPI0008A31FFF|nr:MULTISPECIES: type I restriction-modification system subunit M [Aerococcus]MCY3067818.1 type I restriction-modification system subunit M [Aerococcus mictus]MCY3080631.1 type I restriction-modification system subunit M [Aerococcus mictus]MDK6727955.1 type I restriction-modification system subunit M [Aerococcus urinae]MDL5183026.1 type I restriction-modification system subunit M [Aerococcus loyolae]OFL15456.1 restriction endonuclease subunit M [Aerococcus loyolae]
MSEQVTTIQQALWNSANVLRSKMDANEYKNYTLGIIFYKFLSDQLLEKTCDLMGEDFVDLTQAQALYEETYHDEEDGEDLLNELRYTYSYTIHPDFTFTKFMEKINDNNFMLEELAQGFRDIERSHPDFENLFEDVDLMSRRLGPTPQKRNQTITAVMKELAGLNFAKNADLLGDAYEFLLGQFASESGKKAGEFYTPQPVSELMTRIAIQGKEDKLGLTAYDPTMGSGSLLLNTKKYADENVENSIRYFGQEINTSTYNLAKMNMMLHGVPNDHQKLRNGDTLDADWPTDEPTNFDVVLMNPPYSQKWSADKGFLDDPRFAAYGVLPPKSRADFAFLLHGFYHLRTDGTMCIVLPHGVLFRGASEGKLRQAMLENGYIDAVIGLPENLFYNTSIPTTIIVLKKNRTSRDVFFIDASKEFEKVKTQNILTEDHINKIIDTYNRREDVEKYAHKASYEEIQENDYNLNIPRYVDTFEEPEPIDIVQVSKDMQEINQELEKTTTEFLDMVDDLQVTDDTAELIQAIKDVFK